MTPPAWLFLATSLALALAVLLLARARRSTAQPEPPPALTAAAAPTADQLLQGALRASSSALVLTDSERRVLAANEVAQRLLDLPPDGGPNSHPFLRDTAHYRLEVLARRAAASDDVQEETFPLPGRAATWRARALRVEQGGDSPIIALAIDDVTEVARTQAARREFAAAVSHELRTPLASVRLLAETLRVAISDDPAAAERFLDRIETAIGELEQLVGDLLDLSRVESGRDTFELAPTDLDALAADTVERLIGLAERHHVTLAIEHPPTSLPVVRCDRERIRQVLVNLIHNALKFTPPQGQVTVATEAEGGAVVVSVRDTGVGIAREDQARVFERFFVADRARASASGTGLGLSIAKHIVEAHGGAISVASTPGRGSTFRFSLPADTHGQGA